MKRLNPLPSILARSAEAAAATTGGRALGEQGRWNDRSPHAVSLFRLYLLRALYLLIVVGLGVVVWPDVIHQARPWALMEGVVACMLTAFSALCLLGLRHPLPMLPLLLWELAWKSIWLADVVLPAWWAGRLDEATWSIAVTCLPVLIFPFIIPWRYVVDRYARMPGDRWS